MRGLTDRQISDVIADMVILVDTREQKNQHITTYFDKNAIKYRVEKLDTADYSIILPHYPELGLDKQFLVEKKNSLDEIVGNFTKDRERFKREFERVNGEHLHLVIENATWRKLLSGSYRSKLPSKSFMASLLTWSIRYNFKVWFCTPADTGELIYNILKYELMETLKNIKISVDENFGK
jgi:ERCC4-type nuclease